MQNKNKKIRVLVVDDSFFMKKLLAELLSSDSKIDVVGKAKDGAEAISQAINLQPDVITMDYNMPDMNGAQTIRKILANHKIKNKPAIIMVSAYTEEGSKAALTSLRAGAVDLIVKPSGELSFDIDRIKDEIIEKIYTASRAKIIKFSEIKNIKHVKKELPETFAEKVIVIGASTGGPPVIEDILMALSSDLPAAILVAQHMPEFFISKFSNRLNNLSQLKIKQAEDGDKIRNGEVLVVPCDFKIKGGSKKFISIEKDSGYDGANPSINNAMMSVVKEYKDKTIGIILTGMGEDGKEGMKEIKKFGGYTIAQDPKTAAINSMPEAVIEAGLADKVLSPAKIIGKIVELTK
jgi:two-component system, chemotaxis family, protein-glutamate methylesterase/glutaminase